MKKVILILTSMIAMFSIEVSASTITFEDVHAYPDNDAFWVESGTGHFLSGGYSFTITTQFVATIANNGATLCNPSCPYNGTNYFLSPYTSSLTMTKTGGGAFSLAAFEGAGGHNMNLTGGWAIPDQIDVIGGLSNGGTVSQSFAIDKSELYFNAPLNFSRYSLSSLFTDLISVTFTSSGIGSDYELYKGFSLDNLTVASVSEPGSLALMFAGLGLIGLIKKTKSKALNPFVMA